MVVILEGDPMRTVSTYLLFSYILYKQNIIFTNNTFQPAKNTPVPHQGPKPSESKIAKTFLLTKRFRVLDPPINQNTQIYPHFYHLQLERYPKII
jgi:hypothetical protein